MKKTKKLKDLTPGEMVRNCKSHSYCGDCPLYNERCNGDPSNMLEASPLDLEKEIAYQVETNLDRFMKDANEVKAAVLAIQGCSVCPCYEFCKTDGTNLSCLNTKKTWLNMEVED